MARVLCLCEHASLNGGERSLLAVLEGLGRHGFEICLAVPRAGPLAERVRENHSVSLLPLDLPVGANESLPTRRARLKTAISAQSPDLVHANSLSMSRLSGPVVSDLDLPSVGHLRDIMGVSRAAARDIACHGRLLAVSAAVRDWYQGAEIRPDKIHVLHNGVNLRQFRPSAATGYLADELQLPVGAQLVLTIGQIGMRKGLEVLLAAARVVVPSAPDVHFLIVGERFSNKQEAIDYERQLHQAAEQPPLTGRVHFLGQRSDVHRMLNEATLLVHAAHQEPLGRVLLEAAAAGTPVVATDVGGTSEIFPVDADAARLVTPQDVPQLARAVTELLESPRCRRELAARARRIAEASFDADLAARRLADHYAAVLSRHHSLRNGE